MNIALVMSVFLSLAACNKPDQQTTILASEKSFNNLSYGTDSAQKMDLYLPANRNADSTKLIILIHGGAWIEGDKQDFADYISILKTRLPHYAIANINYRLATQTGNHFPAQENDVQAALNFLYNHRKEYLISDQFVLLGASAGAHLALLDAYKHATPVPIKAVVSFFGPTDLADMYSRQTNPYYQYAMQLLIGGTPASNPTAYQQSSPIYFAGAKSCPTLLLQGDKDSLVNPAQATALKNKLQEAGAPVDLIIYPGQGHGWYGATLNDSFDHIISFLDTYVK